MVFSVEPLILTNAVALPWPKRATLVGIREALAADLKHFDLAVRRFSQGGPDLGITIRTL